MLKLHRQCTVDQTVQCTYGLLYRYYIHVYMRATVHRYYIYSVHAGYRTGTMYSEHVGYRTPVLCTVYMRATVPVLYTVYMCGLLYRYYVQCTCGLLYTGTIYSVHVGYCTPVLHCGSKKNAPTLADYNYDPVQSILIIFSKLFVNDHKSCPVVKFSTSPHICCHYTL